MPTASTKQESTSGRYISEGNDPIKQALTVVDKKVRNLEKRRQKLDGYKSRAGEGQPLEKEQKEAVDRYGEVVQTLEFAKELQKQFLGINTEFEKFMKRQVKREKLERQTYEVKRIRELLQLQSLLDSMGSDEVRGDFQTGKHGAVVLTEENLNHLDELYKVISPSRDAEEKYSVQLTSASEHIVNLLDGKDKEVVGTTYKELKELIDLINNCGYFENASKSEETVEAETEEKEESVEDATQESTPSVPEVQSNLPEVFSQPDEPLSLSQTPIHGDADSFFTASQSQQTFQSQQLEQQHLEQQQQQQQQDQQQQQRQRPFQEIVSSVQGNFNFLQDSEIDMESPHNDPAVVVAHPMAPSGLKEDLTISQPPFSNVAFGEQQLDASQSQDQKSGFVSSSSVVNAQSMDFTNQGYSQNTLSQKLTSDSMFQSSVQNSSLSHSALGQSVNESSQFDMSTGMGLNSSQETQDTSNQNEKKPFPMNIHAAVFNYSPQSGVEGGEVTSNQQQNSDDNDSNQQGFQGGFGGGYRGKGNFRGRGGRGGMSNGYGRSGNSDRGSRGGFQGYMPRNDYQNYQSYNSSNGFSSGFQKRGTGQNRGNVRGAPRGTGPPRGNTRGNRGGFRGSSQQ